jgi:hypothetical protein
LAQLPRNDGGGKVVTRLFPALNLLTRAVEKEAAKLQDDDHIQKYLKKVKRLQVGENNRRVTYLQPYQRGKQDRRVT